MARLESLDTGHPLRDIRGLDVPRTAATFRYFGAIAYASFRSGCPRSIAAIRDHLGNAALAAATALSTSALPAFATCAIAELSCGFSIGNVAPSSAGINSPSINNSVCNARQVAGPRRSTRSIRGAGLLRRGIGIEALVGPVWKSIDKHTINGDERLHAALGVVSLACQDGHVHRTSRRKTQSNHPINMVPPARISAHSDAPTFLSHPYCKLNSDFANTCETGIVIIARKKILFIPSGTFDARQPQNVLHLSINRDRKSRSGRNHFEEGNKTHERIRIHDFLNLRRYYFDSMRRQRTRALSH
jgi:hypothetical protein